MLHRGILLLCFFVLWGCTEPKIITVSKPVDLQRYAGKWYQLASFPTHFDTDCRCTFSDYILHPDHITVKNSCFVNVHQVKHLRTITGKAHLVPGSKNSHWSIEFYWPLKADYWIAYISDDYQYTVVAEPSKNYLWILGRTPTIEPATYQKLLHRLQEMGFDLSLLRISPRCELIYQPPRYSIRPKE